MDAEARQDGGALTCDRERMERERKEKDAKRVTMGGSSRAQGVRDRLPSGGCRKGEKEPKKVKE